MTPLHVAVKKARTEVVKFLVDKEADINIKDGNGVNICMWVNICSEKGCCWSIHYCLPGKRQLSRALMEQGLILEHRQVR